MSVLSLAQNLKYIESIHAHHEEEKMVQLALSLNSRQTKPKVKKIRFSKNKFDTNLVDTSPALPVDF